MSGLGWYSYHHGDDRPDYPAVYHLVSAGLIVVAGLIISMIFTPWHRNFDEEFKEVKIGHPLKQFNAACALAMHCLAFRPSGDFLRLLGSSIQGSWEIVSTVAHGIYTSMV